MPGGVAAPGDNAILRILPYWPKYLEEEQAVLPIAPYADPPIASYAKHYPMPSAVSVNVQMGHPAG